MNDANGAMAFSPHAACKITRDEIAGNEALVLALPPPTTGRAQRFREDALMHLALGRGWLGKCLGALGEPTPYPESDNRESSVIEPPAYNKPTPGSVLPEMVVPEIKQARANCASIARHIDMLKNTPWPIAHTPETGRYISLSSTAIEAARMMLGEELGILGGH